MRELPRPPAWFLWLSFGIALYYLVPVFQEWRRADWRETPVLEIGVAEERVRGGGYVDVSGRARVAPVSSRRFVSYEYQVAGERFYGSWHWQGQPVDPLTVRYDPEASHRSVLKTEPVTAPGRLFGWLWLGVGGLALVLRLVVPAPAADDSREAADARAPVADRRERKVFRLLVVAELVVSIAFWNLPSWLERAPEGLVERIDGAFPALAPGLQGFFAESSSLAYALAILASLGLLAFWRPARIVYAATWLYWIAYGLLGAASLDHGAEGLLRLLGRLLGGAILALSVCGPVGRAFETGSGSPSSDSPE
jgi:hypothetical protein